MGVVVLANMRTRTEMGLIGPVFVVHEGGMRLFGQTAREPSHMSRGPTVSFLRIQIIVPGPRARAFCAVRHSSYSHWKHQRGRPMRRVYFSDNVVKDVDDAVNL
jgi:hypothetical protein